MKFSKTTTVVACVMFSVLILYGSQSSAQEPNAIILSCKENTASIGNIEPTLSISPDCTGKDGALCAALNNEIYEKGLIDHRSIARECETDFTSPRCDILLPFIVEAENIANEKLRLEAERLRIEALTDENGQEGPCLDCPTCSEPACCCYEPSECDCYTAFWCAGDYQIYCLTCGQSVCGWDRWLSTCRIRCDICDIC